jgi:hypothetical protein
MTRLAQGRNVKAYTVLPGDVINPQETSPTRRYHVLILEGPYPRKGFLVRDLFAFKGRIIAGPDRIGDEGELLYGPGGVVRLVKKGTS